MTAITKKEILQSRNENLDADKIEGRINEKLKKEYCAGPCAINVCIDDVDRDTAAEVIRRFKAAGWDISYVHGAFHIK